MSWKIIETSSRGWYRVLRRLRSPHRVYGFMDTWNLNHTLANKIGRAQSLYSISAWMTQSIGKTQSDSRRLETGFKDLFYWREFLGSVVDREEWKGISREEGSMPQ